ncbi:hypothetical protein HDU98_008027 [Podochytrium sp. JEL0797]|nr:hypothetical protein HDU98_008027 [Podochytrium sp. JEL0797]
MQQSATSAKQIVVKASHASSGGSLRRFAWNQDDGSLEALLAKLRGLFGLGVAASIAVEAIGAGGVTTPVRNDGDVALLLFGGGVLRLHVRDVAVQAALEQDGDSDSDGFEVVSSRGASSTHGQEDEDSESDASSHDSDIFDVATNSLLRSTTLVPKEQKDDDDGVASVQSVEAIYDNMLDTVSDHPSVMSSENPFLDPIMDHLIESISKSVLLSSDTQVHSEVSTNPNISHRPRAMSEASLELGASAIADTEFSDAVEPSVPRAPESVVSVDAVAEPSVLDQAELVQVPSESVNESDFEAVESTVSEAPVLADDVAVAVEEEAAAPPNDSPSVTASEPFEEAVISTSTAASSLNASFISSSSSTPLIPAPVVVAEQPPASPSPSTTRVVLEPPVVSTPKTPPSVSSTQEHSHPPAQQDDATVFCEQVSPLLNELLSRIEANPQLIPLLVERIPETLSGYNFGLTIEGPTGQVLGSSFTTSSTSSTSTTSTRSGPEITPTTTNATEPTFEQRMLQHESAMQQHQEQMEAHREEMKAHWLRPHGIQHKHHGCSQNSHKHHRHHHRGASHAQHHEQRGEGSSQEVADEANPQGIQWMGVACNGCNERNFVGMRYKCCDCLDYDLCSTCFMDPMKIPPHSPTHNSFFALQSWSQIFKTVICDGCEMVGIVGDRFKCLTCPDFDLCAKCRDAGKHSEHALMEVASLSAGVAVVERKRLALKAAKRTVETWGGVVCHGCSTQGFSGTRFKCLECHDYDLCSTCFSNTADVSHPPAHGFSQLDSWSAIHKTIYCDACNVRGIVGDRHKCLQCPDYDLCSACVATKDTVHDPEHAFAVVKAESDATAVVQRARVGEVWNGIGCDGCGERGFVGKRFKCGACPDFDFCETCFTNPNQTHHHATFSQLDSSSQLHPNQRCNSCGISSIVGHRYTCADCSFDLCGDCIASAKDVHDAEHWFNRVDVKKGGVVKVQKAVAVAETATAGWKKMKAPAVSFRDVVEADLAVAAALAAEERNHGDEASGSGSGSSSRGSIASTVSHETQANDNDVAFPGSFPDTTTKTTSTKVPRRKSSLTTLVPVSFSDDNADEYAVQQVTLFEMGFEDAELNVVLLKKHAGDLVAVTEELAVRGVVDEEDGAHDITNWRELF